MPAAAQPAGSPADGLGEGVVDVAVIGAGLAGGLQALALAERGLAVALIAPEPPAIPFPGEGLGQDPVQGPGGWSSATAWSYGGVGGASLAPWRAMEQRHGDLGLASRPLRLHGSLLGWLGGSRNPGDFAQVDLGRLAAALTGLLERFSVRRIQAEVVGPPRPQPQAASWQVAVEAPGLGIQTLEARQVVLAAGAGCRALWPGLSERLRISWAGVLQLRAWPDPGQCRSRWLRQARAGAMVLPRRFRRIDLERRAPTLEHPAWVVDPGLVPWGGGALLGQISLVRPGLDLGDPPEAHWMEEQLRSGLAQFDAALAKLPGRYRQVPVSFCWDGRPLVGPVAQAPGLWVLAGFSGAFFQVPQASAEQADAIAAALRAPLG